MKKIELKSDDQLRAIYANANADDKAQIVAELSNRGIDLLAELEAEKESEDEAKEEAFLEGLETAKQAEADKPKKVIKERMNLATCEALAEELKSNVGHKCSVVPFGTIEWHQGLIKGVIVEKRALKVLYLITVDLADGKTKNIVKAHDAQFLTILEETAEIKRKARTTSSGDKMEEDKLMDFAETLTDNVGKLVEFTPVRDLYTVRESDKAIVNIETLKGTIVAIVPEKRAGKILYRIESEVVLHDEKAGPDKNGYDEDGNPIVKTEVLKFHKVHGSEDLKISDKYNEKERAAYLERRKNQSERRNMTTEDRIAEAKKVIEKIEGNLKKFADDLETKRALLQKLQDQLKAEIENAGETPEAPAETEATDPIE